MVYPASIVIYKFVELFENVFSIFPEKLSRSAHNRLQTSGILNPRRKEVQGRNNSLTGRGEGWLWRVVWKGWGVAGCKRGGQKEKPIGWDTLCAKQHMHMVGWGGGYKSKKRGGENKNLRRNWKLGIFRRYCVTLNRHLLLSFFKALDIFF